MNTSPYQQTPPKDEIARVHTLAYDLAFGAAKGYWESIIYMQIEDTVVKTKYWFDHELNNGNFKQYIKKKWNNRPPSLNLLLSFGYIEPTTTNSYVLTRKAFALLEKPSTPPSVFISYKQSESSALALLVESRLKNVDQNVSIFIDKYIESGESINARIEEALERSRFFVCLLGATTLAQSDPVKDEIEFAKQQTDCTIIPICHNGYTPDKEYTRYFGDNKALVIKQPDSAEEYETNMTRLLIRLGYSTI